MNLCLFPIDRSLEIPRVCGGLGGEAQPSVLQGGLKGGVCSWCCSIMYRWGSAGSRSPWPARCPSGPGATPKIWWGLPPSLLLVLSSLPGNTDTSQATRVSSESPSCTATFPEHGGSRNWAPDSFLRESTCYFWLVCKLSELCLI